IEKGKLEETQGRKAIGPKNIKVASCQRLFLVAGFLFGGNGMKVLKIWGIRKPTKTNKIFFLLLPIFGLLSIIMGVVSFYGMQTGDLSVRLNKLTDMNIRIDETPEFEHPRTVLRYAGKKNYRDTRYEYIKYSYLNDIKNANGRYEKEYVLAFTFYLKNTSEASTIDQRSEEHTSELQSRENLVCRLLLEKK